MVNYYRWAYWSGCWINNKKRRFYGNCRQRCCRVGSAVGQSLLGTWGPSLAGMALIPSIIGAVIVVAVVSFFVGKKA